MPVGPPTGRNPHIVREKALRLALRTGWTPDVDLIWESQELDGSERCFGFFKRVCPEACRWRGICRWVAQEDISAPVGGPGAANKKAAGADFPAGV
ncbi:MAG TPA: hypothetical protein VMV81_14370 [Phycisphaerae bacterium]|nr:hypothetical protein [Phycisphaerae bacterium]